MRAERDEGDGQVDRATEVFLRYVLLPGWLAPGLADWACHRRTRIERNAGVPEAVLHCLQMGECGVGILLGLTTEIDAGVLAVLAGLAAIHTATAWADVAYADGRREVTPTEQHVHSFLESLPLAALAITACRHPRQWRALFGIGEEAPCFAFRRKRDLRPGYLAAVFAASIVCIALPYGEELVRCIRGARDDQAL